MLIMLLQSFVLYVIKGTPGAYVPGVMLKVISMELAYYILSLLLSRGIPSTKHVSGKSTLNHGINR